MSKSMRICVAIPTYGREKYLLDSLQQLLDQARPADEIIVVDQTPELRPVTEREMGQLQQNGCIRYFKITPPNTPAARNLALRETTCDIILFIDDDVLLPRDFVAHHLRNYDNQEITAVAGRVIQQNWTPPGRPDKTWPKIMDTLFFDRSADMRFEDIATFAGNHSGRVAALRAIGGYDENYLGSFMREEADAALRLWKVGHRIDFDPEAWFTHLAAPFGGCRMNLQKSEWMFSFSELYFAVRHWFPNRWFWEQVCFRLPRKYIFRKENVFRPWRLPWAAFSYAYATFMAVHKSRTPKMAEFKTLDASPAELAVEPESDSVLR